MMRCRNGGSETARDGVPSPTCLAARASSQGLFSRVGGVRAAIRGLCVALIPEQPYTQRSVNTGSDDESATVRGLCITCGWRGVSQKSKTRLGGGHCDQPDSWGKNRLATIFSQKFG
jgi:hypothetical protein